VPELEAKGTAGDLTDLELETAKYFQWELAFGNSHQGFTFCEVHEALPVGCIGVYGLKV